MENLADQLLLSGVGDQSIALKATSPGISRPLFWVLNGTAGTGNFLSLVLAIGGSRCQGLLISSPRPS